MMERTVWKYQVRHGMNSIPMSVGHQILHFGMQGDSMFVWVLVSPNEQRVNRVIEVVGTGSSVTDDARYVGTVFSGPFVWHAFDLQ